jgi:hypothetical protein
MASVTFFRRFPVKKRCIAILFAACAAVSLTAQEVPGGGVLSGMLNLNRYTSHFGFPRGRVDTESDYIWDASPEDLVKYGGLTGDTIPDTPVEFALLSYYSPEIKNIRPEQAAAMLPADNPRLAGQKLGAALYQEIQILRFLGDTATLGRYEGMLKFVCDKNGVSRAEVESFYRANLRAHIAETVNEEFNKISVDLYKHNAFLARDTQTGQYILSYGGVNTNNETRTIKANSVEALSLEMRNGKNKADFTANDLNTVREKANLIPAVALSQQALSDITDFIYSFYTSTNQSRNYGYLRDVYALYRNLEDATGKVIFKEIASAYARALYELNPALESKVSDDGFDNRNYAVLTAEQRQRLAEFR